ncbi:MAG: DNA-processing protein DprA [Armatimonadota bacterium]
MRPEETLAWLRLNRTGLSPQRQRQLLEAFGSPEAIFAASDSAILRLHGFSELHLSKIRQAQKDAQPERDLWKLERMGGWLLTIFDERYPPLLHRLPDAPPCLYVSGTIEETDERAIAVVGTRRPSDYGRRIAYKIASELAVSGFTVISGLAEGIDTAAHKGALDSGGRTFAVLGCGLDVIYPRSNKELARRIADNGALLTEFPLGTKPQAWHFPQRNRIISGMSLAVIIVEAPLNSGALITADWAAEQGREVFVVPGPVDQPSFEGNHRLLREGARVFTSVSDMLDELGVTALQISTPAKTQTSPKGQLKLPDLSPPEARIWSVLTSDWKHADDIVRESQLTTGEVLSALTLLELKGIVERAEGNRYRRSPRWQ